MVSENKLTTVLYMSVRYQGDGQMSPFHTLWGGASHEDSGHDSRELSVTDGR